MTTLAIHFATGWILPALQIIYVITIVGTIGVVISENRNPVKSLAWVTVLVLLPLVGLFLYFLFGRDIKNKRLLSRSQRRKLKRHEPAKAFRGRNSSLTAESIQQIRLGQSLMSSPFYERNSTTLISEGREMFRLMFDDISKAQRFIYVQFYILSDDEIGTRLADLLIAKAREGVKIKVMYDHVGSFRTSNRFIKRMRRAGIEIFPFLKVTFPFFGSRINWRNHRKIVLIDGRVGYIGGMNVADRYIDGGRRFRSWRDLQLRLQGPILRSLNHSFSIDWALVGRPMPDDYEPVDETTDDNVAMQLITTGPDRQWSNIGLIFLKAIGNAKKRIYLQTPYFLPTDSLLRALQAAALAKIDVRVMIPRKSDTLLPHYASMSYVKECLRAGIKVYLYDKGMLHSKAMVVDDEFTSIGSSNFDFRSFEHNFESNLFIYSKEFNEKMAKQFLDDQADCTRVLPFDWERRPALQKVKESVMRLFSPIL